MTLAFSGRLDARGIGPLWEQARRAAAAARGGPLAFDVAAVEHCDTAGVALLLAAERAYGAEAALRGAREQVGALLAHVRRAASAQAATPPGVSPLTAALTALQAALAAVVEGVAYLGEAALAVLALPRRRRLLRFGDLMRVADEAGVRAVPLALLVGFLMGLILAFQSSVQLRPFGAEIYVVNLVAISLFRELGPLLASVLLAGRTGSAYAAEIGSMKVNEELDALATMGIDPMTMLVLPRLFTAVIVVPVLALWLELAGLVGMLVVMLALGFPPAAVAVQVTRAGRLRDLFGGLCKAAVFGLVVAGIGCRAGLATGHGPRAVGHAATRAVVGGIVATILLDGLFAVVFYRLHV